MWICRTANRQHTEHLSASGCTVVNAMGVSLSTWQPRLSTRKRYNKSTASDSSLNRMGNTRSLYATLRTYSLRGNHSRETMLEWHNPCPKEESGKVDLPHCKRCTADRNFGDKFNHHLLAILHTVLNLANRARIEPWFIDCKHSPSPKVFDIL